MKLGFTNNPADLDAGRAFRDAAVTDGWTIAPLYITEAMDRAARLTRDGFVLQVITRDMTGHFKWKAEADVSIWGPDGLCIEVPADYAWGAITAGLRTCHNCHKTDVDTERYGFAGRCCAECRPAMAAKHERPGWCD